MPSKPLQLEKVAQQIAKILGGELGAKAECGQFKEVFELSKNEESWALKICKGGSPDARALREVDAIKACNHQNIAKLGEFGIEKINGTEYFYYLEEFIDGGTLAQKFTLGACTPTKTLEIGLAIGSALEHLDSLKLVHRDIKPENIMFRKCGSLVLVDFGLVRNLIEPSITPSMLHQGPGTPLYSAPEQLNNAKNLIDWRTDQFSLGVVLARLSSGLHPYQKTVSENLNEVVNRVASHGKVSDEFGAFAKSVGLDVLIKMTSAWPVARYRTPEKLIEHLSLLS